MVVLLLMLRDEYDVQDLLHALLRLHFDDIRPEEWSPSYAGKIDSNGLLVEKEKIVIEVKKTRKGLDSKRLWGGVDNRHRTLPQSLDCHTLVCSFMILKKAHQQPIGLEADLSRNDPDLTVTVIISPKS